MICESDEVLARSEIMYSLNTSPSQPSSSTVTHNNDRNDPHHSRTTITDSTDKSTRAKHIQRRGTMSNAGSTRGHGGSHRGNFELIFPTDIYHHSH